MPRNFINSVKNFREENGIIKFDIGEEFIGDRGVGFNVTSQLCMAREEFCGMANYLQEKAVQLNSEVETAKISQQVVGDVSDGEGEEEDLKSAQRIKVN